MISKDDLKPGDHIYSWRTAYIYAHHGIYMGDNMVIHFTRGAGQETGTGTFLDSFLISCPSNAATPCPTCGDQSNSQGVIKSCLDCFLLGCNLYLFHYSVSPSFFLAKARGGTCTLAASDTPDTVLHRANYLLDNGFGTYHIFKNNCEDFAVYCKTGLITAGKGVNDVPRSGQLTSLTAAVTAFASSPVRYVTAVNPFGLAVAAAGMYCASRYVYDVGVRSDAVKVDVECLTAYMGSS